MMNVKAYALSIWQLLDPIYFSLTRLIYLEEKRKCILRVRLTTYKGREIILTDGTHIKKNDKLLKIHLHNVRLIMEMKDIKNETKRAFYAYKRVKDSLPSLAKYLTEHKDSDEIKGIIGITMLKKGVRRLGFEIFPINSKAYQQFRRCSALPIHILSSNTSFMESLKNSGPDYLIMSKGKLMEKYR